MAIIYFIFIVLHVIMCGESAPNARIYEHKSKITFDEETVTPPVINGIEGRSNLGVSFSQSEVAKSLTNQHYKNPNSLSSVYNKNEDVAYRFPELEDDRLNWGLLMNGSTIEEDEESYNRPISIPEPQKKSHIDTNNKVPKANPLLAADYNNLAQSKVIREDPLVMKPDNKTPDEEATFCEVALVICCVRNLSLENCLRSHRCLNQPINSNTCRNKEIGLILRKMSDSYAKITK